MTRVNPVQLTFNAGELSSRMLARVDFDKYASGLALMENVWPLAQGGAERRPGTRYVAEVKDSSKTTVVRRFEFSTVQVYIIEFGDQYCRFYRNQGRIESGGSPVEISTPYAEADLRDLKFAQSADVLYVTHPDYAPRKITRTSHTSWSISELDLQDGPYLPQNTTSTTLTPSAASGSITITASSTTGINGGDGFKSTDVGRVVRLKINAKWGWAEITGFTSTTEVDADVKSELAPSYTSDTISFENVMAGSQDEIRDSDGQFEEEGFVENAKVTVSGASNASNNDTFLIETVTADRMLLSLAESNPLTTESAGATVTISGGVSATTDWQLGLFSDTTGYPAAVTFYQERLYLAGSDEAPQRFDASVSADFENFRPTELDGSVLDDNALSFTISSGQVNRIRWITGAGILAIGTVGGEFTADSDGPVLTPSDLTVRPQTANGCANIAPLRIDQVTLFVQRAKRKVREFVFRFETDSFTAPDLTQLADHVTEGGLLEVAYQQEPNSIMWCVRNDGQLAAMTYRRDEGVIAWGRHILGGSFSGGDAVVESVATVPGNDAAGQTYASDERDEVWVVVKRTINGATKRYIEFMEGAFEGPRHEDYDTDSAWKTQMLSDQKDAFYVDSGLSYDGSATTTISGLDHLEGETVKILADGAIHPDKTVASGQITLDYQASKVHAGLAYTSWMGSLKQPYGARAGTALVKTKRAHRIGLVLQDTGTFSFGTRRNAMSSVTFREVIDDMDTAVPLFTGERLISLDSAWEGDPRWYLSSDNPAPLKLLAVAPEMDTNDTA